ncbi:P-loop containing nucleoside triphosphate hydrolase protein [Hygrophoropsis aurantiaca]|uniref:P-loop containing nucleoside triphosphate hydrolase protein n=1 Tax=Hygrophoropsis aurantiaca TaxID=72124 RepID=A0ACB8AC78_9AGAM|nr:P-loop containing nucleoside triphosphate hydrolase protein [Hygrophoropsis aurantiaca]
MQNVSARKSLHHVVLKPYSLAGRPRCNFSRLITSGPKSIFKDARSVEFLSAAGNSASIPDLNGIPELIVTGRANVGKSSLLNAVVGRKDILFTSKKAGRTQTLNFYRVGQHPGKLVVVDSPGYGARGRPEWGAVFRYYLENREELRRIYVLLAATHGVTSADQSMLSSLDAQVQSFAGTRFTLQAIVTKADTLRRDGREQIERIHKDIFAAAPTCLPPIIAAIPPPGGLRSFGVDEVRRSIVEACGIIR